MEKCLFFIAVMAILISCNQGKEHQEKDQIQDEDLAISTAERIAFKNGFARWNEVKEINFTFNIDRGERHFERAWTWKPKLNEVIMRSKDDTISYNRDNLDSLLLKTDARFINDKYWLLAPFQLIWDSNTTYTESQNVIAPISKDTLNLLTVLYGNEGGYTPGDAYDLYYSNDFMIREWQFRESNDSIPTMTNTWEEYEEFNGIKIAKTHRDSTGSFKLYFSDINIK